MAPHRLDTIVVQVTNHLSLPGTKNGVRQICAAVKTAAAAPAAATEEALEHIESMFLSSIGFDELLSAIHCAPLWAWVESLVIRRFSETILIPAATEADGTRSRRVGLALIRRLEELNLIEIPNASEEFLRQYDAEQARRETQLAERLNPPAPAPPETVVTPAPTPIIIQQAESNSNAASNGGGFAPDPTRFRRSVQMHFMDTSSEERTKFTGDLTKGPSFDLWEKRYRSLMKTLKNIEEGDKVQLLSEALADPALTFFYNDICPDDARAGMDLAEASANVPLNMAANVATLSGALAAIRKRFCTDAARNVLKQELDQLTLAGIEQEEKVSKPEALSILKDRIRRLSCNGPPEFRSEPCMIAALRKCLTGEEWAVDPIINARDWASQYPMENTLEHYVQRLVSYLRERETLSGSKTKRSSSVVPTYVTDNAMETYYGDARASPRHTRVSYNRPQRSRPQQSRPGPPHGNRRPQSGLPAGMDLRRMLLNAPQQQSGSNQPPAARARPRSCWNCDETGHLLRNCPHPRRSRLDFARAMLVDDVSPTEVAIWMAQDADELLMTQDANDGADNADVDDVIDAAAADDADDPVQVFDTLLATMSRDAHPRQDFR